MSQTFLTSSKNHYEVEMVFLSYSDVILTVLAHRQLQQKKLNTSLSIQALSCKCVSMNTLAF